MAPMAVQARLRPAGAQTRCVHGRSPALPRQQPCLRRSLVCRAEKPQESASTASSDEEKPVASSRQSVEEASSRANENPWAGALEEINLITWVTPQKALADTVLVLAVVVASGFVLFGSNVALTNMSEWWYSN